MTVKKSNLGYKITIFLLFLALIVMVFDKITSVKYKNNLVSNIEEVSFQKDSLRGELDDLYLAYNSLETNNKDINDSLFKQKQKVAELIQELKNTKSGDYARIQILKKEIATLKKVMKSFVKQIDSLYQQNQILIVENTNIKNQYSDIVLEKDQLSNEKDSLQQTVKVAKALTAYSIQIEALNRRGKSTTRIRKAEKFQVCFLLSENKISTTGRKYVYLRVTKPSGEVLRNTNSGFFNYKGQSIAYSAVKEIEYNGNSQNICVYYNTVVDDLPDGNYTVFIFIDGTQIGDAKINLN